MPETLKVLVAGDDEDTYRLLHVVLEKEATICVVGHVTNGIELGALVQDISPHAVLLDLDAPGDGMLTAVQTIKDQSRQTGFVGLVGDSTVDQALLAEVDILFYKNAALDGLSTTLRDIGSRFSQVGEGETSDDPEGDALQGPAEAPVTDQEQQNEIVEPKRANEVPAGLRDFYLGLVDELPTPVWRSSADGNYSYFNRSWFAFTGRTYEQEAGDGWTEGIHQEDLDQRLSTYRIALREHKPFEIEYRLLRSDGEYRWVVDIGRPFNDLGGNFAGYIGICHDITERKRNEQQLAHLATHDALTGLPNRRTLEDTLKRVLSRARRGITSVLLLLDVDNFKIVNDAYGHVAGDRTLVTLTQLLQNQLRTEDLLARLGGDEFVALLEGVGLEEAKIVAERTRRAVDEFRFILDGQTFNLSLSIGLVTIDGKQPPLALLSQADAAMYKAKELGRNRIALYRHEENGLVLLSEENQLVTQLKDALRKGLFILNFQPVVRLSDGRVDHYEALVRLRGGSGDVMFPGQFLPTAERLGLMPQLTRWIVQEAIRTLRDYSEIRLHANLSSLDLSDESLPEFIEARLRGNKIDPARLGFEIAEMAIGRNMEVAEQWIRRLKALGCRFALDNFGSGFVPFSYLRSLPVDQFKIAGAFVRTLDTDPSQRTIVQAVQTLARMEGKETVAEWVENEAIAQILKDIGILYGQGFYLGATRAAFSSQ